MKYIVCTLDDENYTSPTFTICDTEDSALYVCRQNIAEYFENVTSATIEYSKGETIRYEIENSKNFLVNEILSFDETNGEYLLIRHHAYNGVGFNLVAVGTLDTCRDEMEYQIQEILEDSHASLEWENAEQCCIDIETEWIVLTIFKIS